MARKLGLFLTVLLWSTATFAEQSDLVGDGGRITPTHTDSPCYPRLSDLDGARPTPKSEVQNRLEKCVDALSATPIDKRSYHLDAAMQGVLVISGKPITAFDEMDFAPGDRAKVKALKLTGRAGSTSRELEVDIIDARDTAIAQGDLLAEAYSLNYLATLFVRQDRLEELQATIDRITQLSRQLGLVRLERDHLHFSGQLAKARGDTVEAIEFSRKLIDLHNRNGAQLLAALTQINMGNVVYDLGDFEMALGYYQDAQRALEENGRTETHNFAAILKNIGSSYTDLRQHEKALPYYERATAIDRKNGNLAGLGYNYFWHAKSLDALGRRADAIRLAREGATLSAEHGSAMEAANSYVWLAARELDAGDDDAALRSLLKGANLAGLKPGDDPQETLDKGHRYWAVSFARTMAEVLERTGQRDEALRYANYALDMHSDWLEAEKIKASVNAQTLFELGNREKDIALLEQQNALRVSELESQRMGMISALAGVLALAIIAGLLAFAWRSQQRVARLQQVVLREEHHRTRNALQLASSLTRSHERTGLTDMREIRQRLQTMALLHDHLHPGESEIRVDLCSFVTEVAAKLEQAMAPENVSVIVECEKIGVPPSIATPLGLMICEMIINSCKYAFPSRGGTITLGLVRDGASLNITVCDDGVGNTSDDLSTPGTGTQLIDDLAEQIGTEARFEQSSQGSCWYLGPIALHLSRLGVS